MIDFFKKHTYAAFIFSLLCGIAYFMFIYEMLSPIRGAGLISFFFCPAVVCGVALFILKLLNRAIENENKKTVSFIVIMHIIVIITATLSAVASILY